MKELKQPTLPELEVRRTVLVSALKVLRTEVDDSDPRKAGAIEHYTLQLAEIDRAISEITGKPPDIVIGLKPGRLVSRSPRQGE